MSIDRTIAPFMLVDSRTLKWVMSWRDGGCGSSDYAFYKCTNPPAGYAPVGDSYERCGGYCLPEHDKILFVSTNRPDVAKPANGFTDVGSMNCGDVGKRCLYLPKCNDPNYIGVALVTGCTDPTGTYYCINSAYLDSQPGQMFDYPPNYMYGQGTGSRYLYRAVDGTYQFTTLPTTYKLHTDAQVRQACMGEIAPIGELSPQSDKCSAYLQMYCSPEDIKVEGKCYSWCGSTSGQGICDGIKTKFCQAHPDDPFCDCILASSRPSFQQEQLSYTAESLNSAPRPCRTALCRNALDGVNAFVLSQDETYLEHCPSLTYVDQSVSVAGSGNVVQTTQSTDLGTKTTGGGAPATTASGILDWMQNNMLIVLVFIVVIASVIIFMMSGDDSNTYPPYPPQYPQQPYYQQQS